MKHGPTYKQKGVSLAARAQGDGKKRLQRGEREGEGERGRTARMNDLTFSQRELCILEVSPQTHSSTAAG